NNAYCQDDETSWHDWTCLERHQEIYRFARGLIALRGAHPILSKEQFYADAEIEWLGPQGGLPAWTDPKEKRFGCLLHEGGQNALCLLFNAGTEVADFRLPRTPDGARWHLAMDTCHEAPQDLFIAGEEPLLDSAEVYHAGPRSSAILVARPSDRGGG
ncbi:MAG TPA: hypothetical protein VMV87_12855, partial [Burkholderiales bacterium]|nr:hypothetical protein [Burkholderiales bacterium]